MVATDITIKRLKFSRIFILFVSFLFFGQIINISAQNWQVVVVDTFSQPNDISLALDSQNHPHIVYSRALILKYAKWNGIAWEYQILDTTRRIETNKICLDQNDHPHIGIIHPFGGYYNRDYIEVLYSYHNGVNWQTEKVDSFFAGDYGAGYDDCRRLDMTLSANGTPHLVYPVTNAVDSFSELRYAYKRGATWIIDTIWQRPVYYIIGRPRISLDTIGNPVIGFDIARDSSLYCAYIYVDTWTIERIANFGGAWTMLAFALKVDAINRIHFLYWVIPTLGYALKENNNWNIEWFGTFSGDCPHGDMALLESSPHIVASAGMSPIGYRYKIGSTWYRETIPGMGFGFFPSIAIDQGGDIHVSGKNGILILYARRISSRIEENRQPLSADYIPLKIYPNPTKTFSIIRYSLPVKGKVLINLYDISGRKIKTLVDEYKKPGNYSITLNTKSLSAGVYFLFLESAEKRIIERLVIIK